MTQKSDSAKHFRAALFLLPAFYAPTSGLRAAFHRLRGVDLSPETEVGYQVLIDNLHPDRVHVARYATLSARCTILAHDEAIAYAWGGNEVVKDTYIGERAFIGVASIVLAGSHVGQRAIIGAGSVVTGDIPPDSIATGVPARVLRKRS